MVLVDMYATNEKDRLVRDLIFTAFCATVIAYPVFLYFIIQRDRLKEMNTALEVANQKAKHADIAKCEFLSSTSHEIRTPIIGVTACAMTSDKEKCLAAGMDDCLTKPISPDMVEEKIEKWMPGNQAKVAGQTAIAP